MTLFIKACRIVEPHTMKKEISEDPISSFNWVEFESSLNVEDVDIPLIAVLIHHVHADSSEEWLLRPRDFEKTRDWVFDTKLVSGVDKPKLIWLLNEMEEDSGIYLHFSW